MAFPDNVDEADTQIDATINRLADQYASCDRRSAEINDERATIRSNIDKLGINPKAFVHAVAQIKQMNTSERNDYQESIDRVLSVIGERQGELYPEAAERIRKRDERAADKKAKEGRTSEELDEKTNTDPKSDPKNGGAGREPLQPDGTAWPDDAEVAARAAEEQAEGESVIEAAAPKLSQSAKAKAKLAEAGLT